jgi:2,4-dienoyl-CoA reductase (NADPH2)
VAAERGHRVTLFDAADEIGGQFNLAKRVPGKEEFHETIRYYSVMLDKLGVDLKLGQRVSADDLKEQGFDHIVVATGITPRVPELRGIDHPMVVGYIDAIMGRKRVVLVSM